MTTEPSGTHGHFQQVESEDLKAAGVACGTSGQEEFNGLAVLCDHHMNLETIKVTLLGGGVPSIPLVLIEFASSYPNVVTSSHREGVHDVDALLGSTPSTFEPIRRTS